MSREQTYSPVLVSIGVSVSVHDMLYITYETWFFSFKACVSLESCDYTRLTISA